MPDVHLRGGPQVVTMGRYYHHGRDGLIHLVTSGLNEGHVRTCPRVYAERLHCRPPCPITCLACLATSPAFKR